jgi:thermitase
MKKNSYRATRYLRMFAILAIMLLLLPLGVASATDEPRPTEGELLPAAPESYPLSDTPVEVRFGDGSVRVFPLKTVRLADGRETLADRIIVAFQPNLSDDQKADVHRQAFRNGAGKASKLGNVGDFGDLVDVSGAPTLEAAIRAYQADARVKFAEPDLILKNAMTPNDPELPNQWGVTKINATDAWDYSIGSSSVKIAVLDTGIAEAGAYPPLPGHPEINSKVVGRKKFAPSYFGTYDIANHGTHVAGIAAAKTDNKEGVAGIGYNSSILNGKVLGDDGKGALSMAINGIYWAANKGAKVINMSLGAPGSCSSGFALATTYAMAKGALVVASAGNDGLFYANQPASCPFVVAVANTMSNDLKSPSSTWGNWVHVAAPGSNIRSLNNFGGYANFSGTSMAAPHVSGLAALLWATGKYASPLQVSSKIFNTADSITGTGVYWQYGRINALKALLP